MCRLMDNGQSSQNLSKAPGLFESVQLCPAQPQLFDIIVDVFFYHYYQYYFYIIIVIITMGVIIVVATIIVPNGSKFVR